jgi:hypothetical protein
VILLEEGAQSKANMSTGGGDVIVGECEENRADKDLIYIVYFIVNLICYYIRIL